MLGADVVVDPDRPRARIRRIDRLADEFAPEAAAVLAAVLALGGHRAARAHLLVPGGIALELLAGAVDRMHALADQLARPVAEHLLEARIAALVGAILHERDADRGVVEDQLLLGERTLHALVGLALCGDVLEAPDPFLHLIADVDAPAARAAAVGLAVAALEAPFGIVRGARRGGEIGKRTGALPVLAIGEQDLGALANQLARAGAHHLLEIAVAALDDAVPDEGDADGRVVENQLLLGERALDALLGFVLAGDVLDDPHR